MVFENSLASRMAASWKIGQRVALMGPTGASCEALLHKPGGLLVAGDADAALFVRAIGPFAKAVLADKEDKQIKRIKKYTK